jgi:hypothetical protein
MLSAGVFRIILIKLTLIYLLVDAKLRPMLEGHGHVGNGGNRAATLCEFDHFHFLENLADFKKFKWETFIKI